MIIDSEEFKTIVQNFRPQDIDSTNRFTSFDYCFDWFQTHKEKVADDDKIEQSCLHLMCYLASWGMLRGSSILLQKSVKFYEPLVRLIAGQNIQCSQTGCAIKGINQEIWNIDVDKYDDYFPTVGSETQKGYDIVLDTYEKIQKCLYGDNDTRHIVAVTKIMMGVFGCVPALDRFFCETFKTLYPGKGFASPQTLTKRHLECINNFYNNTSELINDTKIEVLNFNNTSEKIYPKAKIIDMYGFGKSYPPIINGVEEE